MADFKQDVIDKSYEQPVVVDFWASWCGPCQVLGPVLDQIAKEQSNQWSLVKIDTEADEALARTYQIRSIPNVKMFYRGEIIDEFSGALPRQMILKWLEKALPDTGLMALDQLLSSNPEPSVEALERLREKYPMTKEINLVLSQMLLWEKPNVVENLLADIKMGTPHYDKANDLRRIAAFLVLETEDDSLLTIKKLFQDGQLEDGIKKMLEVLAKNNAIGEGKLTKAAIGIFNTLGIQHPYTKAYRKHLDMLI